MGFLPELPVRRVRYGYLRRVPRRMRMVLLHHLRSAVECHMSDKKQHEARTFTKDDWKALYFVHRLAEQVTLHGAPALETFLAAAKEFPDG
jgi:hypothetical protein